MINIVLYRTANIIIIFDLNKQNVIYFLEESKSSKKVFQRNQTVIIGIGVMILRKNN
jgi:hypothetical protein